VNGTRLSERKTVSYTAVDHPLARFELIYENNESGFDDLVREVEELASSVQLMSEVNEQLAEAELRALNVAQAKYFAENRCYGTLDDLIRAELADARVKRGLYGYGFSVRLTQDGYRIDAFGRGESMYTEQDGVIRRLASRRPRSR
jgi:hypothetical protein